MNRMIKKFTLDNDNMLGFLLLLPLLVVILGLIVYPLFSVIWLSLNEKTLGMPLQFVGFRNFFALVRNEIFYKTVLNTFLYTIVGVFFKLFYGMIIALFLNQQFRARNYVRGFLLLPWAVPAIVSSLTWRWIYDDMNGVLNFILMKLHIFDLPVCWLANASTALPSVMAVSIWRHAPFFGITLLAALQSIPKELYEAADVDGASKWQKFWNVDLPGISAVLTVVTLIGIIWTFNEFQIVYVLTNGGPAHASEVFSTLSYQTGIKSLRLGEAAAISLMFLPFIGILITITTNWLLRKE